MWLIFVPCPFHIWARICEYRPSLSIAFPFRTPSVTSVPAHIRRQIRHDFLGVRRRRRWGRPLRQLTTIVSHSFDHPSRYYQILTSSSVVGENFVVQSLAIHSKLPSCIKSFLSLISVWPFCLYLLRALGYKSREVNILLPWIHKSQLDLRYPQLRTWDFRNATTIYLDDFDCSWV